MPTFGVSAGDVWLEGRLKVQRWVFRCSGVHSNWHNSNSEETETEDSGADVERLLGAIAALEQYAFDPVKGSLSGCTCEVQGLPSERENRGVQELHREGKDGEARLAQLQFLSEAQREQWVRQSSSWNAESTSCSRSVMRSRPTQ